MRLIDEEYALGPWPTLMWIHLLSNPSVLFSHIGAAGLPVLPGTKLLLIRLS